MAAAVLAVILGIVISESEVFQVSTGIILAGVFLTGAAVLWGLGCGYDCCDWGGCGCGNCCEGCAEGECCGKCACGPGTVGPGAKRS